MIDPSFVCERKGNSWALTLSLRRAWMYFNLEHEALETLNPKPYIGSSTYGLEPSLAARETVSDDRR